MISSKAQAKDILTIVLGIFLAIREKYRVEFYDDLLGYMGGTLGVSGAKNNLKQGMKEAFYEAAERGWLDGGAKLPLDSNTRQWLLSRVAQEETNIDAVFVTIGTTGKDVKQLVLDKANSFADTLNDIYNIAKVRATGEKTLIFDGDDGDESCKTCQELKGQSHPASWWIDNDLVPYRGNPNLECGGWNCKHYLMDEHGNLFTI